MSIITSDEVNYLIYRYLQESGYAHSAFAFGHESLVLKNDYKNVKLQPGALISALQRGLMYMEAEAHLMEDGAERDCSKPFSLLHPHECDSRGAGGGKKKSVKKKAAASVAAPSAPAAPRKRDSMGGDMDVDEEPAAPTATKTSHKSTSAIPSSDVLTLAGHTSEVYKCAWHPSKSSVLATASEDATVRVWQLPADGGSVSSSTTYPPPLVLRHSDSPSTKNAVSAIRWSPDGRHLVSGAADGDVRIWSVDGGDAKQPRQRLPAHRGAVFSIKFNPAGSHFLTCGADATVAAWAYDAGSSSSPQEPVMRYAHHQGPVMEIDWRDDQTFSTASSDHSITVCQLGQREPQRKFEGHKRDVNEARWSKDGRLLASCSDDATVKVWSMDQDRWVHDLRGHEKEVFTCQWAPGGQSILASASIDTTVKLWDVETGRLLHNLSKHKEPVYSLAFSPDGRYVASGSGDQRVIIWSVRDGTVARHYKGPSSVYEVAWSPDGRRVATTFFSHVGGVFEWAAK